MRLTTLGLVLAAMLGICGRSNAVAPVPVIDIDPQTWYDSDYTPSSDSVWGWTFYVYSPVTVTHLAFWDKDQDGLDMAHSIGIWRDLTGKTTWEYFGENSQLVCYADVPSGTSAELNGEWRRVAIDPITLPVGGYAIGALIEAGNNDAVKYMVNNEEYPEWLLTPYTDPRIEVGAPSSGSTFGPDPRPWYFQSSYFHPPNVFILAAGVELGPTFYLEPVPEPHTLVLLVTGAALMKVVRRQRA